MKSEETRNRLRSGLRALGSGRAASAGVAALRAASVARLRAATAALLLGAASVLWGCSKESPAGGASGTCPGEASDADIGIAGGDGVGLLFKKGEIVRKVPEDKLVDELVKEVEAL